MNVNLANSLTYLSPFIVAMQTMYQWQKKETIVNVWLALRLEFEFVFWVFGK